MENVNITVFHKLLYTYAGKYLLLSYLYFECDRCNLRMTNLLEKHRTYILIIFMDYYDMSTCFNFMLLNEGFQSL